MGTTGLPKNITLTNIGNVPFTITSVAVSTADFGQLNSCGNSLAAGANCSIGVFFDPTVSGARAGTLTITDGAAGSPQTVALSGTGQDFSMGAAAPASATVKAGQTAIYTLTLAPDGGFVQPVTFTGSGAPANSNCVVSPNPAMLNGPTATATVTVSTTAASLSLREFVRKVPMEIGGFPRVLLASALLALIALWINRRREWRVSFAYAGVVLLVCALLTISACGVAGSGGGGGQPGTTAGTYTLTVTATFSSGTTTLTHQTNLTLVVQ